MTSVPWRLSETPLHIRRAPPLLGQHTDEVLRELGHSDTDSAGLRADGVI